MHKLSYNTESFYNKWKDQNINDLHNLFDLYCDNINGFLNIDQNAYNNPSFFDDFCKFIWKHTSNNLKKYK